MGLFQKAYETYEAREIIAGVKEIGKVPLAPKAHIIASAGIEITLDGDGNFLGACRLDEKIPIPCTEASSGRTSTAIVAHPLCDQLKYVGNIYKENNNVYLDSLKKWVNAPFSNAKVEAVYKYVCKENVISDLSKLRLVDYNSGGCIQNEKDIITWRVIGLGSSSGAVHEDRALQETFFNYYTNTTDFAQNICMITGINDSISSQHIKIKGNAKIISSNDKENFTYKGRFSKDSIEAMSISYEASQKAHNALKWLLDNESISLGDRFIICWNPSGYQVPRIDLPLTFDKEDNEASLGEEYADKLEKVIYGYKSKLPENESIVIAAFEAATSGRLSVTYYNELQGSDFLERLKDWDLSCCWHNRWGESTPSLLQIANYAFGTYRGDNKSGQFETDKRIIGQQMQRLISCRVDKSSFPLDIVRRITGNAGQLHLYSIKVREQILFTACAVIKKSRIDNFKEVFEMSLEPNRMDRSYQYGRLLAVLEKIERDTYGSDENRETNAIRTQAFYVQRPHTAFSQIMTQLKSAYYPRLGPGARAYYDKLIGEIIDRLSGFDPEELNKSLSETYLMGYYLQRNELYTRKNKEEE